MNAPTSTLPTPLHLWASLRTELVWAYDGAVSPDCHHISSDSQYHAYYVWFLRQGDVQIAMDKKKWRARAGQWVLATTPHGLKTIDFSDDAAILSIHFRCQWPTGENLFSGPKCLVLDAKDALQMERYGVALRKCVERYFPNTRVLFSNQSADLATFLRLQRLFFNWLEVFAQVMLQHGQRLNQSTDGDARLMAAVRILDQASSEGTFPGDSLTLEAGLCRAHLDRLFWRQFGVTTREYWEKLRENIALEHLGATKLSIKEIGFLLGFRQPSHFTKWFQRRLGNAPTDYREKVLRKRSIGDL